MPSAIKLRIKTDKYTDVYVANIDRYNSQANFLTNVQFEQYIQMDSLNLNAYTRDICMRTQKLIETNRSMLQVRENKTKKKKLRKVA